MNFLNIYDQGFARVAARVTPISLAEPAANAAVIAADLVALARQGCALIVYPELCLTGSTCGDLFRQDTLTDAVEAALEMVREATRDLAALVLVGAPLRQGARLFNCAIAIRDGAYIAVTPQAFPPHDGAGRWFSAGLDAEAAFTIAGREVPSYCATPLPGAGLPFRIIAEVGDDAWAPRPPHAEGALAGAQVIAHLAAPVAVLQGADERRRMARAASTSCRAAYLLACAGPGESSTDAVFDGQTLVAECGDLLSESTRYPSEPTGATADVDLRRIANEREDAAGFSLTDEVCGLCGSYGCSCDDDCQPSTGPALPDGDIGLLRPVDRFPFVATDADQLMRDCREALDIQVTALVRRIEAIGGPKPVLGVSGGLDSTVALIVCARAMDRLGRPRRDIQAFTMPGFATSSTTTDNALALMRALDVTSETLDIRPAANQMLADLDHPYARGEAVYDVTFENVQAGLRADYLFRIANQRGGFVVGTGDLSELALGWATYGVGDHMSHYGVNGGIPKTLLQHMIGQIANSGLFDESTSDLLRRIVAQEISPELVPGASLQSSEGQIGPYPLNDFFCYHTLRWGSCPARTAFLAWHAWHDATAGTWPPDYPDDRKLAYDLPVIKHWLGRFYHRFFANQYKRSALADGPRVCPAGSLSPRGGFAMPSDARPRAWLDELDETVPDRV